MMQSPSIDIKCFFGELSDDDCTLVEPSSSQRLDGLLRRLIFAVLDIYLADTCVSANTGGSRNLDLKDGAVFSAFL